MTGRARLISRHTCYSWVGAGIAAMVVLAAPVHAAEPPVAPPPTPGELVAGTNAMLQPGDVTGALAQGTATMSMPGIFRTGFNAPPGGQDPLPVCVVDNPYSTVSIPTTLAVGFSANVDTVRQDVYQYPSAAAAQRVWNALSDTVRSRCTGTVTLGKTTTTLTTSDVPGLPGAPGGLGVLTNGSNAQYSVLHLAGDSVQMVTYAIGDGPIASGVTQAANSLAATLATRWITRSELASTQNAEITKAESMMLTLTDVPASLPVTEPRQGGWSGFSAYLPGNEPMICNARAQIPAALSSFSSTLGGDGGPLSTPGSLVQYLDVYPTPAAAQTAWAALTAGVRTCKQRTVPALSQSESIDRRASGTSAMTLNGVPGVWSRTFSTNVTSGTCTDADGAPAPCPSWSSKSYTIHLLVGSAIQTLTYYTTRDGVGNVPLDQAAVNTLAEDLAQRWSR